ncbi:LURP-one-related/scramblase family protein [Paenibacillus sp. CMAA1364]
MELYFKDKFFSSGTSDIMRNDGQVIGQVDLKSAFTSSLEVWNANGQIASMGKFRMLLNQWVISDGADRELGVLHRRMSFLNKKYEYHAQGQGVFEITSPAFSNEYRIQTSEGKLIASFARMNGGLQSGAFRLLNESEQMDSYELVAIVMGVHEIQKRDKHN